MVVTSTILNHLYWRALVREGRSSDEKEVSVKGLRGGLFVFNRNVLERKSSVLLAVLRKMPLGIRRSVSPDGIPWIMARKAAILSDSDDVTVERVLVMCMALGFLSMLPDKNEVCDIPYVIMDDVSLVRKEKLKERGRRPILLRWFCE